MASDEKTAPASIELEDSRRASSSADSSDPKYQPQGSDTSSTSGDLVVEAKPPLLSFSGIKYRITHMQLAAQTVTACVLGFCIGLLVQMANPSDDVISIIGYPGVLFIRVLKLIVLPLIAISMAQTPSKLGDMAKMSAIGKRVLVYYLSTTFLAAAEGLVWVNVFNPGKSGASAGGCGLPPLMLEEVAKVSVLESILGIGTQAIDENLMGSFVNTNILGVIFFFMWFGLVLAKYKEEEDAQSILKVFNIANTVFMDMINLVIKTTPIGVFSLILAEVSKLADTGCMLSAIGIYVVAAVVAYAFHVLFIYPAIYFVFTRKNAWTKVYKGITQAFTTALSTSSSAATLPVTLRNAIDNNGVDEGTANFVLPLGATVNMDGTALGFPIAAIFLANIIGQDLSFGNQVVIAIVSSFVSIGAAPIPSAGLVYLVVILEAVNIPVTNTVSFILAIDWFIDRCQTAVNICGDSVGVSLIDHMVNGKRKKLDAEDVALEGGEVSADRSDVDSFSDEVVKPTKATDSVDREERSISM